MTLKLSAGLVLALAGTLLAETTPEANVPKETKDKVSYSIGADIGSNMKRADLDINADFLAQGIRDGLAGKTIMTEEEMQKTLQAFQTEMKGKMESKQKALGEKNKGASEKFLEENKSKEGVKTTASGLQYKIIAEGKGDKPKADDTVSVHYKGTLPDGTEFDSSYKRNEPATFPVTGVIPGWTEALQMMPVGSKWQLVIPPALAYGENAPPMIGPNQALVFEVELLEIKKAEKAAAGDKAEKTEAAPEKPAKKKK